MSLLVLILVGAHHLYPWTHADHVKGDLILEGKAGYLDLTFMLIRSLVAVAAWIGSAYFFTSSTSFANPAVTVGRIFSDTFAGIDPASVAPFVLAQLIGAGVGFFAAKALVRN